MIQIKKNDKKWELIDRIVIKLRRWFPDKLFIKIRYRAKMGYFPNLKKPTSFTEKINWLKLYYRKPEFTTMVDKYSVKEYIANKIGEEYLIPTIGVWESPDEIEWDKLPDQFVLKTTHGGGNGGVIICRDKDKFDKSTAILHLKKAMERDIYWNFREWPYKNVRKRIIAEKLMTEYREDGSINSDLSDYKFFCFNGEPKYCQVIRDRNTKETIDFYDMDWKHQCFVGLNPPSPNAKQAVNGTKAVKRPEQLQNMISLCQILSKNIPFLRVDFYIIENKIYFGELTFYPASGLGVFNPEEWNDKLGDMIKLPNKS